MVPMCIIGIRDWLMDLLNFLTDHKSSRAWSSRKKLICVLRISREG